MPSDSDTELLEKINWGKFKTATIICVSMLTLYILLLFGTAAILGTENVQCFMVFYFRGLVGIPSAIIMATTIVVFLASGVSGNFAIKALGVNFEGPSAPITMWVICFLVLIAAIAILFPEVAKIDDLPERLGRYCAVNS